MVERRSLLDGITTSPPPVDPEIEKAFVYSAKATPVDTVPSPVVARAPLSTRIRADFAAALKKSATGTSTQERDTKFLAEHLGRSD